MLGWQFRTGLARLLAALAIALLGLGGLIGEASLRPAQAQEMMVEFRDTLGAYGRWVDHPRWGAVWVPDGMPGDWRPYRTGHWVYTDEWGWYWVADEEWGWIAYHYGRWVFDRDVGLGWVWIPGTEWSPAWVSWRRGEEAVGWAPMPPDEVYVAVQDEPSYWLFVRAPDIIAPSIAFVVLPAPQAFVYVQQTVVINQTVIIRENNRVICANPGVPPSFVAAKIGRPIQTVSVAPHVLRGTVGVTGAVVGAPPRGEGFHEVVKPQAKLIQPAAHIDPPTPFRPGQPAKLGPDAPNALKRANLAPSGPAGAGGGAGAPGGQPGQEKPSTGFSSRTPAAGPGNLNPQGGNLRTGKGNQPTGHGNLGQPGPGKPNAAFQSPGGNSAPDNKPRPERHPMQGNIGQEGPGSKPLTTHPPSNPPSNPPPNLRANQSPPNFHQPSSGALHQPPSGAQSQPPSGALHRLPSGAQHPPPSGALNQPLNQPLHPPPSRGENQPPRGPQSNALMNQGGPPRTPPQHAPSPPPPPQGALVHQAPPPPQRSANPPPPPPQHQQKCQTVNGQQVCR